jgi:hypothetical protein
MTLAQEAPRSMFVPDTMTVFLHARNSSRLGVGMLQGGIQNETEVQAWNV